jgi:hypothetical protein
MVRDADRQMIVDEGRERMTRISSAEAKVAASWGEPF